MPSNCNQAGCFFLFANHSNKANSSKYRYSHCVGQLVFYFRLQTSHTLLLGCEYGDADLLVDLLLHLCDHDGLLVGEEGALLQSLTEAAADLLGLVEEVLRKKECTKITHTGITLFDFRFLIYKELLTKVA